MCFIRDKYKYTFVLSYENNTVKKIMTGCEKQIFVSCIKLIYIFHCRFLNVHECNKGLKVFQVMLHIRAGYREKFQNWYTYVQEFTVTEKYWYWAFSWVPYTVDSLILVIWVRLTFAVFNFQSVLAFYFCMQAVQWKCYTHTAERDKNTQFDTRNCFYCVGYMLTTHLR